MQIKDLSRQTGLSTKTIRYYEEMGVLPEPQRLPNGYRVYGQDDLERVRFVVGARRLAFSLDDIAEIIAMRDRGEAPCQVVLDRLDAKANEIEKQIAELKRLEGELRALYALGHTFPLDDVEGKNCVCHLVKETE